MNSSQRRVVALAAYLVALVLFLFFFGRPFWQWATWSESRGTLDLGFVKITTRPPFPSDAKSVIVGLVIPIVLGAFGKILEAGRGAPGGGDRA